MSVSGIGQRAFGGIVGKVNGSAAGNETIYDLNFVLSGNLTQYIPRRTATWPVNPKVNLQFKASMRSNLVTSYSDML